MRYFFSILSSIVLLSLVASCTKKDDSPLPVSIVGRWDLVVTNTKEYDASGRVIADRTDTPIAGAQGEYYMTFQANNLYEAYAASSLNRSGTYTYTSGHLRTLQNTLLDDILDYTITEHTNKQLVLELDKRNNQAGKVYTYTHKKH